VRQGLLGGSETFLTSLWRASSPDFRRFQKQILPPRDPRVPSSPS
jgi:hypothetical protein